MDTNVNAEKVYSVSGKIPSVGHLFNYVSSYTLWDRYYTIFVTTAVQSHDEYHEPRFCI